MANGDPVIPRCALRPPLQHAIWAYRNWLKRHPHGCAPPEALRNVRLELANHLYRYTVGPDIPNDELGYGEEVVELTRFERGGVLFPKRQVSRRTKTGRHREK
jgi:hypothetical protein